MSDACVSNVNLNSVESYSLWRTFFGDYLILESSVLKCLCWSLWTTLNFNQGILSHVQFCEDQSGGLRWIRKMDERKIYTKAKEIVLTLFLKSLIEMSIKSLLLETETDQVSNLDKFDLLMLFQLCKNADIVRHCFKNRYYYSWLPHFWAPFSPFVSWTLNLNCLKIWRKKIL